MRKEQRIVCAAVKTKSGKVICGPRHYNCFCTMSDLGILPSHDPNDQGFVNQYNDFLTREEAVIIAEKQGQFDGGGGKPTKPSDQLFSEDLY